eukprot:gene7141-11454_t
MESDHAVNKIDEMEEMNKKYLKKMSEKYNFDFENDKPLDGKFEWTKVIGNEDYEKTINISPQKIPAADSTAQNEHQKS